MLFTYIWGTVWWLYFQDDECTLSNGFQSTSDQRLQLTRISVFNDPPQDFPARRDIHVLKFLAGELISDEWLTLSHWLQVRAPRIQNIRRRADLEGWDDYHMKLEMLTCWFKTQQRSVDKVSNVQFSLSTNFKNRLLDRKHIHVTYRPIELTRK